METAITRSPGTTPGWLRLAGRAAGAVARQMGVMDGRPLPRLVDVHPQAARATRRWRGVVAVPVADIVGTASYQTGTRRADFQPVRGAEPADFETRWTRLEQAAEALAPLPPIELFKMGEGYWVVDGHNRVALAKATGQRWLDADVTELLVRCSDPPSAMDRKLAIAQGGRN